MASLRSGKKRISLAELTSMFGSTILEGKYDEEKEHEALLVV